MTVEGLEGVRVSDPLILTSSNRFRGSERVTVSRIGRTYLYVEAGGREKRERFDRVTGVEQPWPL